MFALLRKKVSTSAQPKSRVLSSEWARVWGGSIEAWQHGVGSSLSGNKETGVGYQNVGFRARDTKMTGSGKCRIKKHTERSCHAQGNKSLDNYAS